MKPFNALVAMQVKNKLNFSGKFNFKFLLRKVFPFIFKIAVIATISYFFFYLCGIFSIFSLTSIVPLTALSFFLAVLLFISCVSCTIDLSKDLFISEDNKVLITYPIQGGKIFLSKLIVYYFSELFRSLSITIPIILGYGISVHIGIAFYFWMPISFLFVSAIPVVIGMIFSVPTFYVERFLNTYKQIKIILSLLLIAFLIWLVIYVINLIPNDLNLVYLWPRIYSSVQIFLAAFQRYFYPIYALSGMIVGLQIGTSFSYAYLDGWLSLIYLVLGMGIVITSMYFIIKPFYISMTAKSFETTKSESLELNNKNKKGISPFFSCLNKEIKLMFRDSSYITGLLGTYIVSPLLVLLIVKIFMSLSIKYNGTVMAYAFSLLIITLPIFASNSIISTIFSREGRAGYIKKTNPINPLIPITAKLVVPIILSFISLLCSMGVFAIFSLSNFSFPDYIMLTLATLIMQIALILYAALNDLKNPKNEAYATSGDTFINSNEVKTTIVAFLASGVFALMFYIFMTENKNSFIWVGAKMLALASIVLVLIIVMYIVYIRSCYIESGEAR